MRREEEGGENVLENHGCWCREIAAVTRRVRNPRDNILLALKSRS